MRNAIKLFILSDSQFVKEIKIFLSSYSRIVNETIFFVWFHSRMRNGIKFFILSLSRFVNRAKHFLSSNSAFVNTMELLLTSLSYLANCNKIFLAGYLFTEISFTGHQCNNIEYPKSGASVPLVPLLDVVTARYEAVYVQQKIGFMSSNLFLLHNFPKRRHCGEEKGWRKYFSSS